ncbi:hypothetical protein ALC56_02880 [Trachymyrmex septentrionalis]|uniref:Uncharacterized protein n=1 Tax=Trachymyrmex septentrionalis TaxID=34720 RepID=A0A151JZU8_9HYME|nr:hypothetical protein ALC56_02880 [Trachymyrmex septentrionalis]
MIITTVDAPFSNGLNERLNQTLINKIRCKINENEEKKNLDNYRTRMRKKIQRN